MILFQSIFHIDLFFINWNILFDCFSSSEFFITKLKKMIFLCVKLVVCCSTLVWPRCIYRRQRRRSIGNSVRRDVCGIRRSRHRRRAASRESRQTSRAKTTNGGARLDDVRDVHHTILLSDLLLHCVANDAVGHHETRRSVAAQQHRDVCSRHHFGVAHVAVLWRRSDHDDRDEFLLRLHYLNYPVFCVVDSRRTWIGKKKKEKNLFFFNFCFFLSCWNSNRHSSARTTQWWLNCWTMRRMATTRVWWAVVAAARASSRLATCQVERARPRVRRVKWCWSTLRRRTALPLKSNVTIARRLSSLIDL